MPNPTRAVPCQTPSRFRPRGLPTLAMLAAVALFVAAGHWQQRRMHEKETLRAQLDTTANAAALTLVVLPTGSDWSQLRYHPVVAAGVYDPRRQIFIDNKVHGGRAGYDVVTPLKLADGRVVLVNRGWIPQGASRAMLPDTPPPDGEVTVQGRLALPGAGYFELEREAATGPVWQNLDPARIARATGLAVLPVVVEQTVPAGPSDGLVRDRPPPDFGIEKHWIYMMQWYAFAVLALLLWLVQNFRKSARAERG